MKNYLIAAALSFGLLGTPVLAADEPQNTVKKAGSATKKGAKAAADKTEDAGEAVADTSRAGAKKVAKGTKKAARVTADKTEDVGEAAVDKTKAAGRKTKRAVKGAVDKDN